MQFLTLPVSCDSLSLSLSVVCLDLLVAMMQHSVYWNVLDFILIKINSSSLHLLCFSCVCCMYALSKDANSG